MNERDGRRECTARRASERRRQHSDAEVPSVGAYIHDEDAIDMPADISP